MLHLFEFLSRIERIKVLAAQFDVAGSTTLVNVTGMSHYVLAGKQYRISTVLHATVPAIGGHKYALGGTCTATSIVYHIGSLDNTGAASINSRQAALGGSAGVQGETAALVRIEGVITVANSGTLTLQFAQFSATATSSLLPGSTFSIIRM